MLFFILSNTFFLLAINPLLKIGVTEFDLAKILVTQKVIYSDNNIDERKFIKYRIESENSNPEILIFGSSRMMQIGEKTLNKKSLNLSVSNAIIKDFIAIIGKSIDKFKTQKILIGIDPWTLYYNYPNSWQSISNEYYQSLLKFNSQEYVISKITKGEDLNNIKPNELSLKIYELFKKINSRQIEDVSDKPSKYKDKIRRDGSRVVNILYLSKYQLNNEHDIKNDYDFKRWLPDTASTNCNNSSTDKIEFENFLDYLKQDHQIILVLPPYHPTHYNQALKTQAKCRGSNSKLLESEIEIRELAKRKKIRIIGSFDPEINDCKKDDFIDWIHPKESCMKKVLRFK
jgi:hypothetical protein